jgi:hypothetical protein
LIAPISAIHHCVGIVHGRKQADCRIVNISGFSGHAIQFDDLERLAFPESVYRGCANVEPAKARWLLLILSIAASSAGNQRLPSKTAPRQ